MKSSSRSKPHRGSYCKSKDLTLYPYQRAVAEWFKTHPHQKGMLIQFGTGTGKTLVAANLAEMMMQKGAVDGTLVIAPTSLVDNFYKAIRLCRGSTRVPSKYLVETYGRIVNMVEGRQKGLTKDPKQRESFYKKYPDAGWLRTKALRETLLVIDEAHNLKNVSSKRTKAILKLARDAKHVLLLTATPFVNSVSDISPLMHMIVKDSDLRLWPAQEKLFRGTYQNRNDKYKKALGKNIAYHFSDDRGLKPKVVRHVHKVDLEKEQIQVIDGIRAEMGKAMGKLLRAYLREEQIPTGANLAKLNAFLVRIRQAANSLHGECGPKIKALVKKAMAGPKPAVVYSEFKGKGVEVVRDCLVKAGVDPKTIAYFHGSLSKKERSAIVNDYNDGKYDYLLITSAGSEGLSLKATRQVHVLEPFWNMAKILQVLGRGVRVDSHGHLPPKDRRVDVSYWISVVSDDEKKKRKASNDKDLTTLQPDVHVWAAAKRKEDEMEALSKVHKKVSIPLAFPKKVKKALSPPKRKKQPSRRFRKKPLRNSRE